jgi:large subunit ribosomal protein L9
MPTNVQVILQQDLGKLGKSGDLVKVRPGFARNYLLPRGFAVPATTAQINRIAHEKAVALAKADKAKKEAQELAAKIAALAISIPVKVGDEDRLFGSVTIKDIHAAVKAKGLDLDRKKMHLADAIKALGDYVVDVRLLPDVHASLKVSVVKK